MVVNELALDGAGELSSAFLQEGEISNSRERADRKKEWRIEVFFIEVKIM
jgi:hypothetical protein